MAIEMSDEKPDVEKLLNKADLPNRQSMVWHPFYEGKIEVSLKVPVKDFSDFGVWYTPGVAKACMAIHENPEEAYRMTNKWNSVAVVSDGSRVLGLGNIGPEASLPVMEGKGLLFKYLGGVDAYPVVCKSQDPDDIIQFVKWLQPAFGGINLEDFSQPKCFRILDELRADPEINIPIWHDDQQGTASITLAGIINSAKIVGKNLKEMTYSMVGAGAANMAISRVMIAAGVPIKNIIMIDSKGILSADRPEVKDGSWLAAGWDLKHKMATESNVEGRTGDMSVGMKDTDCVIACSKPGPNTISKAQISSMSTDAIVLTAANPVPEIWPWEAKEAGARVVGTGRSDFDNQINNSLGFPAIFRGTLDVRATTITDGMAIAAAYSLATFAETKGIRDMSETYIVPLMSETQAFIDEAVDVALKAIEEGVARLKPSRAEIEETASRIILRSRAMTEYLMADERFIPPAPDVE
jgi:malate dehydrogenase (oxaloacetate-decarboxylating)